VPSATIIIYTHSHIGPQRRLFSRINYNIKYTGNTRVLNTLNTIVTTHDYKGNIVIYCAHFVVDEDSKIQRCRNVFQKSQLKTAWNTALGRSTAPVRHILRRSLDEQVSKNATTTGIVIHQHRGEFVPQTIMDITL